MQVEVAAAEAEAAIKECRDARRKAETVERYA